MTKEELTKRDKAFVMNKIEFLKDEAQWLLDRYRRNGSLDDLDRSTLETIKSGLGVVEVYVKHMN